LTDLESLSALFKLKFFQLQRGPALQETFHSSFRFQNPKDRSMDLCNTASLVKSLDAIISVDTMVAHLAGALGKKIYLLLHSDADWRWLRNRNDSPWYPTARLLRQSQAGDWKPVVAELVDIIKTVG
jgi:ADP-heptose:LPS heptosyltransferase